jgi:hypothetical protein
MTDITSCANTQCEHTPSCYRAKLYRECTDEEYSFSAHFSRDPKVANRIGFDCYWPIPKTRGDLYEKPR